MTAQRSPQAFPEHEKLYVGIDVAKKSHIAAFLSTHLLKKHINFNGCPVLSFENSRIGFESLVKAMQSYVPPSQCTVVLERTGHYHLALEQYLQEQGIEVYELHLQKRPSRDKSDKRDAQSLANLLYNQIGLRAQPDSSTQIAHRVEASMPTAVLLRGLVRHRIELTQEMTRRKNKLTAICDQIFPELALIIKDINAGATLRLREKYRSAAEIAQAPLEDLIALRHGNNPGKMTFMRIKEAASRSIGITDAHRIEALYFEKCQLIAELRLLESHEKAINERIEAIIATSREGRILTSIPGISPTHAAAIIASIRSIANFEKPGRLRGYFGWSPRQNQTGTSYDSMVLTKTGNRTMKRTMYLIAWYVIRYEPEWSQLYLRRVEQVCRFDARTGKYKGKNKVIGRIIGQLIGIIWRLLKADYDLLAKLKEGQALPPPMLYNRAKHRAHMDH